MIVTPVNTLYLYFIHVSPPFFGMFKTITLLILINLLAGLFISCGSAPKAEEVEPIEALNKPEIKEPTVVEVENPTADFRMLKNDTALPTPDQLSDGAETSLGYAQSDGRGEDEAPATTVKPPRVTPEDQLAPSE